jgi:hypothetical protein
MARSIRIPFLADLKMIRDMADVKALSASPDLDRRFEKSGPLINRLLLGSVKGAMNVDGKPLPSVAPRTDAERARNQVALREQLDPAAGPLWDAETLGRLVAAVRGETGVDTIGPAAQQAVGRVFVKTYVGNAESWQAARDLDDAVHSKNIFRRLALNFTGQLRRSRRLLADRVNGSLAGVHGTGIAVHNMVHGFATMRELLRAPGAPLSADEAIKRCLVAPPSVLRQANAPGHTVAGDVRSGTILVYELEKIRPKNPDAVFMTGTWAECPALLFVPALYAAVWNSACAAEKTEKRT